MKREITYNKDTDKFTIILQVPKTMEGNETYGDGKWVADAVCIYIDEDRGEYGLFHTQYLDYKDSLQATMPIIYFDTEEEARNFGLEHSLMIQFAR